MLNESDGKVGKVKDFQLKLNIKEDVKPVVQRLRNTRFHLRKQVEEKIKELLDKDIIEEVKIPTPWVSPIVIDTKKDGDIRICTDMRAANKAIEIPLSHTNSRRCYRVHKGLSILHR